MLVSSESQWSHYGLLNLEVCPQTPASGTTEQLLVWVSSVGICQLPGVSSCPKLVPRVSGFEGNAIRPSFGKEWFFIVRRSRKCRGRPSFSHKQGTLMPELKIEIVIPVFSASRGWARTRNEVCRGGHIPRPRYYFFIELSIWAVDYLQVSTSWRFQGRKICPYACGERFNKLRISVGFKSTYFLNFPFTYFYPVIL